MHEHSCIAKVHIEYCF